MEPPLGQLEAVWGQSRCFAEWELWWGTKAGEERHPEREHQPNRLETERLLRVLDYTGQCGPESHNYDPKESIKQGGDNCRGGVQGGTQENGKCAFQ